MSRPKPATLHSYWLMFVATVITVGIVTASQLVTSRIGLLLDRQASELLAADLVVLSAREFATDYGAEARRRGLQVSHSVSLRTAVFIDGDPRLVELKAVDAAYPLRGQLERAGEIAGTKSATREIPAPGEVWVDTKLAQLLGGAMNLGEAEFAVSWLLTYEPDRGGAIFNLAPRVLMNLGDLPSTGLVVPGSRVEYRVMFAGNQGEIARFKAWLGARLQPDEEIQDLENARPEMRRALDRTRNFFALAIVLTLVIAMAAIAITARYTARQEAPKVAMLRAFGISQASLFRYYLRQLGILWLAATVCGALLGWLTQFPLQWALHGWFGKSLPAVSDWRPFVTAGLVGLIALAGFSLPYLLNATATPPMQVLRTMVDRRSWLRGLLGSASAVVAVFVVLMLLMQSSLLAVATLGLILGCALLLPLILASMVRLLLFSSRRKFWLRQYLLSRLQASSRGAVYVMSGFSLVLIAILMIAVVKDEILGDWQAQLPEGIPNYFLVNIPGEDIEAVGNFMRQNGIESSRPYALVRARLTQINGVDVERIDFSNPRAETLVQHTFNMTYAVALPEQNAIVSGKWIDAGDPRPQLSVEQGMAERLGLEAGDELTMSIGSEVLHAQVTSIRTVVWENFKPNFFIISNPALLEGLPQTGLLSALIKDRDKASLKRLLHDYPSITLLDITELMARVRAIVDQASVALEFFFLFALASASIVLLAAIQTGRQEREIESSLLRALSAQTSQLYRVHVLEFTLMGGLIGFFSAAFATLAGWAISVYFFDMEFHFSPAVWCYSLVSASLVLTIAGTLVSRRVYNISPMKILRS
ncbi:MAG TPA: FtsX-like permease family protein [Gammaproteobacteria bacterium]|nr:FtsX-like permease family protein [Gammaproteobacteria bacterium]